MPDITTARKIVVSRCIDRLPANEKERAQKLYAILDKLEWLTIVPFHLGLLALIVLPILQKVLDGKLPGGEGAMMLWGFVFAVLFYAVSVFALKKLVFNPRRNGAVEQARTMLSSDDNYRNTLETLKLLDPSIARIIRKFIS